MYPDYANNDTGLVAKQPENNNWLTSSLIVVVALIAFVFVGVIFGIALIPLAVVFCVGGLPYAVIVAIYMLAKGKKSRLAAGEYDPRFINVPQQVTFLINCILALNLLIGAVTFLIGGSSYIFFCAVIALFAATISIGFNAPTIFGKVGEIERSAIRDKASGWEFILVTKILALSMWFIYAAIGMIFACSSIFENSFGF